MINETLKEEIKELEFDFEREIKALEGIVYNNPSQVFFDIVLIKYDHENNTTKKVNICKWNGSKNFKTFLKVLKRENVFFKNIVRKENVYVAVTPRTKFLNFIWLDDVDLGKISQKQKEYMTIIQTSENSYQAFIKLDRLYKEDEIQMMKEYLIDKLGADEAAKAKIQPMRLPGFYSYKRKIPFYVKVSYYSSKTLEAKKLLEKAKNTNNNKNKYIYEKQYFDDGDRVYDIAADGSISFDIEKRWRKYSFYKKELEPVEFITNPEEFYFNPEKERDYIVEYFKKKLSEKKKSEEENEENEKNEEVKIDDNRVDLHYIFQLLIRNYEKSEIYEYIKKARPDITDKHQLDDYFERTYLKALVYSKAFFNDTLFNTIKFNKFIEDHPIYKANKNIKKMVDILREIADKLS